MENQDPTNDDENGLEHVNDHNGVNAEHLSSRHNDSCTHEYDASRIRRRCATASSEGSDIE